MTLQASCKKGNLMTVVSKGVRLRRFRVDITLYVQYRSVVTLSC